MTAAPGPLGAPAGVATIQPAGVAKYPGRWAEAALLRSRCFVPCRRCAILCGMGSTANFPL